MLRAILVQPFFNILLLFYALIPGHDFGIAVILLTVVIRMLLWPLTNKQLHHTKTMRELQPEIAKIKTQAKGDRQKESMLMMELFKIKKINPFASLGLALVQFPILIGLFFVLQRIIHPEQIPGLAYGFIEKLGAVKDILANPASFDPSFLGLVHMAKPSLVLALIAGVAQYFQAKQITPVAQPGTPNIGATMNYIFPVVTVVFAAQLPSALALYWAFSSLIAIYQQHLVLNDEVSIMRKLAQRKLKKDDKSQ